MRTSVYIDGFNLYYGSLRKTPFKWLDINKLCHLLLPNHKTNKIKYFTARVSARINDPDLPNRQQTYFRAISTLANVEIILGHFLSQEISLPMAGYPPNNQKFVKVIKFEEKGSDVNLATHLLNDGYKKEYDVAVLITNDSDLLQPVRIVRDELNLAVGIINPHKRPSRALIKYATFIKKIRKGVLAASQFPETLARINRNISQTKKMVK